MKPTHDWDAMREHMMTEAAVLVAQLPTDATPMEQAQGRGAALQVDISIFIRRECADYGLSGADIVQVLGFIMASAMGGSFGPNDDAPAEDHLRNAQVITTLFAKAFTAGMRTNALQPKGGDSDIASGLIDLTGFRAQ